MVCHATILHSASLDSIICPVPCLSCFICSLSLPVAFACQAASRIWCIQVFWGTFILHAIIALGSRGSFISFIYHWHLNRNVARKFTILLSRDSKCIVMTRPNCITFLITFSVTLFSICYLRVCGLYLGVKNKLISN